MRHEKRQRSRLEIPQSETLSLFYLEFETTEVEEMLEHDIKFMVRPQKKKASLYFHPLSPGVIKFWRTMFW